MRRVRRRGFFMDSIKLVEKIWGNYGKKCRILVINDDIYEGMFMGAESFYGTPLFIKLQISKEEANRIGAYCMSLIGINYDLIKEIEFI